MPPLCGTSGTWQVWNICYTDANSSAVNNTVWQGWQDQTVTAGASSNAITQDTWARWVLTCYTNQSGNIPAVAPCPQVHQQFVPAPLPTPEEIERRKQESARILAEQKRAQEEYQKKRKAAKRRARRLLYSCLTRKESKTFHKEKAILVVGSEGRRYRISEFKSPELVDAGDKHICSFCIAPGGHGADLPEEDKVLAHKLSLETDEKDWLKRANVTQVSQGKLVPAKG